MPEATVSTPVDWSEIPSLDPRDFTVLTVPNRLREKGELHARIDDAAHSLERLLEWADRDEAAGLAAPDDL